MKGAKPIWGKRPLWCRLRIHRLGFTKPSINDPFLSVAKCKDCGHTWFVGRQDER